MFNALKSKAAEMYLRNNVRMNPDWIINLQASAVAFIIARMGGVNDMVELELRNVQRSALFTNRELSLRALEEIEEGRHGSHALWDAVKDALVSARDHGRLVQEVVERDQARRQVAEQIEQQLLANMQFQNEA